MEPKEIDEMIENQKKHDPRMKKMPIEMSADAVRCPEHGRVVLQWDEAFDMQIHGYECPVDDCPKPVHYDNAWHEGTKDRFIFVC